ncbi:ParB/RepB/Spo0J family partition protein [Streptomyces sp. JNUCC 64]
MPRLTGEDEEYARQLALSEADLPPILVHGPTMNVVDGVHRLRAARLRGHHRVAVRFFEGSEQDAAHLAIALNVAQGRPLSPDDRAAAAVRVLTDRPEWSDRAVAAVVGLSPVKVAQVRQDVAESRTVRFRVGRDGRARPVNAASGRERASELIRLNPHASLRQVAKEAGIAPATVADVRDRMRRGEDPVPARLRPLPGSAPEPPPPTSEEHDGFPSHPGSLAGPPTEVFSPAALRGIVHSLHRDPSLRLSASGRNMLRLFGICGLIAEDRTWLTDHAPPHCMEKITKLADGYAEAWRLLAEELRSEEKRQRRVS